MVRGYESSPLFREDCLLRIQHLQMEVDADMKRIKEMENEYAASEERLRIGCCLCKQSKSVNLIGKNGLHVGFTFYLTTN